VNARGCTPLFFASEVGAVNEVKELLRWGQYKSIFFFTCVLYTTDGMTYPPPPLPPPPPLCPPPGANVLSMTQMRESAVFIASLKGHSEVVRELITALTKQLKDWEHDDGRKSHQQNCHSHHHHKVDSLSRFVCDGEGFTPLHAAVIARSLPTLEVLLATPIFSVNQTNRYQQTPLHLAARNGGIAMAELLLQHGADRWARDETGSTPWRSAFLAQQTDMMRFLASLGCGDEPSSDHHHYQQQRATKSRGQRGGYRRRR